MDRSERTSSPYPPCTRCGEEVLLGEPMYWTPERPGHVWHDPCAQREGLLPSTLKPMRSKRRKKAEGEPLF
ncbi:hypothetical protein [Azospirillum largimobile]